MSRKTPLRNGYTTGTCASAAAKAGIQFLLCGHRADSVDTPLPNGERLVVPIHSITPEGDRVRVSVVKDGGDDPDVTHGSLIQSVVSCLEEGGLSASVVEVHGGKGVGRVTLPGLPVEVGRAAINPVPRGQIAEAVREVLEGVAPCRVSVVVEVPKGEALAKKTMNPRLGIVGGISILGTQGIVRPYSHASWKASIAESLDVAKAQGLKTIIFTTGRRSEKFYAQRHFGISEQSLIQAADFFSFSMQAAAERGFKRVQWSLFFGKLVKHAQGLPYTHAKTHPVDFALLSALCAEAGIAPRVVQDAALANTARQVLGSIEDDPARPALLHLLVHRAKEAALGFAAGPIDIGYSVFDFDARVLFEDTLCGEKG